jgi:hypothetical protein
MMEAASTSETSINFYQTTQRYNPEGSHLQDNHSMGSMSCPCVISRLGSVRFFNKNSVNLDLSVILDGYFSSHYINDRRFLYVSGNSSR